MSEPTPASSSRQLATIPGAPPPAKTGLFRQEVLAERQARWLGTVLIAPRMSYRLFAGFAILAIAATVALLCFGEYTRKARINGWLVPDLGLIQVHAPLPGVVVEVYVKEGDEVASGAPLLLLSTEVQSEAIGGTREEVVRRLHERRASMVDERARQNQLFVHQTEELTGQLAAMNTQHQQLQHEIDTQRSRVALADRTQTQVRDLRARQLVTEQRLQLAEQDDLDQAVKLQSLLESSRSALDQQVVKMQGDLRDLPLKRQTQLGETDRSIATLDQEVAQAESQRQILITAPHAGTVSALQTAPGGSASASVPLLTILPLGSQLQAQLFSASRAIGFVRAGQKVQLRYQAFPYQKFGTYEGHVVNVSGAALSPSELPQQLTGLTSLFGTAEPVYRITVALAKQTATAYGASVPLQPGMQLEADVIIERQTLIQWALDPLYTMTGGRRS